MFSRVFISVLLFSVFVLLIFLFKPSLMFDANGNLKKFDIHDSMITIEIAVPIIAILSYFIALLFSI